MNSIEQTIKHNQKQTPPQNKTPINYNGFTNPPPFTQILPIILFFLSLAEIIYISIYNKWEAKILALFVLYGVFSLVQIILWYVVTKIDPTDSIHLLHKKTIKEGNVFDSSTHKFYCRTCETFVSRYSFHCKKCQRCVEMFDHHCKWLNNCIGAKNYLQFIGLISITQICMIFHLTFNVLGILANGPFVWVFYIEIVSGVIDLIILILVSILLGMHIYLILNKKTTIELILERRKNNKIHPSHSEVRMHIHKNKQGLTMSEDNSEISLKKDVNVLNLKSEEKRQIIMMQKYSKEKLPPIGLKKVRVNKIDEG